MPITLAMGTSVDKLEIWCNMGTHITFFFAIYILVHGTEMVWLNSIQFSEMLTACAFPFGSVAVSAAAYKLVAQHSS